MVKEFCFLPPALDAATVCNGFTCLVMSDQSHLDVLIFARICFCGSIHGLLIGYGTALPGLGAIFLFLRPLTPQGLLVAGELSSVTCHCVAERGTSQSRWPSMVLGLFVCAVGAAVALWRLLVLSVTTMSEPG